MKQKNKDVDINYWIIYLFTIVLGLMIVTFNIMGYDVLFADEPLIPFIPLSPIGLLLLVLEIAVLAWTSAVIKHWPNTSAFLKWVMVMVVGIFWFLSYAGVSSYLHTLASSDVNKVREYKQQAANNAKLLSMLSEQSEQVRLELEELRVQRSKENQKIAELNKAIDNLSVKASDRRQTAANCELVSDCKASVAAFMSQIDRIEQETRPIRRARDRKDVRITSLEKRLDELTGEINTIQSEDTRKLNGVANAESNHEMKKAAYANTIEDAFSAVGITLENPFQMFINLLAFIIYPMYFFLNLYTSLLSEPNREAREKKLEETADYRKKKKEYRSLRYALGIKIRNLLRTRMLRKKREVTRSFKKRLEAWQHKRSLRVRLTKKLLAYFRVWAHRRKKTINVAVETIVEKPIEVEKIVEVEKVVEVEVEVEIEKVVEIEKIIEKEVPKEVDRIVKVPTEVPVFVDKVKTVPEPFFVKDPEIIIHERIIPVPENITGIELEELLNAQPRLNQVARPPEEEIFSADASEGRETGESSSSSSEDASKGAAA